MTIQNKVRGMQDILPDTNKYLTFLKKIFRHEFRKNGFRRITTPIIEFKSLFTDALGNSSDIQDQIYCLNDKNGKELVLKPEATIPLMRSYIENNLIEEPQPVFLYYMDSFFRYENPNKGTYRQFEQIGGEVIGEIDPILDAQLIYTGYILLKKLGLEGDFKIKINSLGTSKDMKKYLDELLGFYENKKHLLTPESIIQLSINPLLLLDSKNEDEIILALEAPKITNFLKKDSKDYYKKVMEYLDILKVPYEEDHRIIKGPDYFCHTVWEYVDISGRNNYSFGGGSRYCTLSKKIGHSEEIPGVGISFGANRIIETLIEKGIKIKNKDRIDLYFIQLGEDSKKIVLPLTLEAREKGINTLSSLGTPSLKVQMKKASRINARFVVMVGLMEVHSGLYQVRNMVDGTQEEVKKENLINYIISKIGEENLNFYCPSNDLIYSITEKKD